MARYVGIDMIDVDEIRESLRTHGPRYLERVYTVSELRDCATSPRRLAQCFAAKEATMKALASPERLPWHSIVVDCDADGRRAVVLTGAAAELARERGVRRLAVSVSGDATQALAVVLATG